MIKIQESEMSFGEFQEENLFHIEKSKIYKNLGDGIKTVEFILRYDEKSIVFLEAKKSYPNVAKPYVFIQVTDDQHLSGETNF